jgi:hypothetical protein
VETALAILIRPESPLWKALLWGGIAVFVARACVLLFDYFKPDSRPIFLIGAATGIALFFGFGIALILDSRSLIPEGSKPIQIVFRNEAPFVTVAPAGVNRRRMIRVRIDNSTDKAISNGRLDVSELDPPYRDHPNWLLKDAISVAPHDHTFVEVVYYDEGSSQAKPGTTMLLAVPMGGGFFAEAYPSLPLTPHTFFLKFSTLERGLSDEMYCKIYVASDQVLHFENRGDLTPQKQSLQTPLRDPYDQNLRWALEQIAASTVFTGEIDAAPDELRQAARNGTVTIYGRVLIADISPQRASTNQLSRSSLIIGETLDSMFCDASFMTILVSVVRSLTIVAPSRTMKLTLICGLIPTRYNKNGPFSIHQLPL